MPQTFKKPVTEAEAEEMLKALFGNKYTNLSEERKKQLIAKRLKPMEPGEFGTISIEEEPNNRTQLQNHNVITPEKEKKQKSPYQWAVLLTAEQKEDEYFWTEETKALLNRLKNTTGNLIAVIGLQGTGKTALRQALTKELFDNEESLPLTLKWIGDSEENIFNRIADRETGFANQGDPDYLKFLLEHLIEQAKTQAITSQGGGKDKYHVACIITKKLGLAETCSIDLLLNKLYTTKKTSEEEKNEVLFNLMPLLPKIEKLVGPAIVKEAKEERLWNELRKTNTLLIDFPDYDQNNRKQQTQDWNDFQVWWEKTFAPQEEARYEQKINIVIFYQKELWHGNFMHGKFDTFELKPLKPAELVNYYTTSFPLEPFSEEALLEIATLSRGIFRRFKKYVRQCLDKYSVMPQGNITLGKVAEWVGLEQIAKDMELELLTIFPKARDLRLLTVKLLRLLREKGPLTQALITQEIFDGAPMKAVRVLDKLESYPGYIKREWAGRDKIVCLA